MKKTKLFVIILVSGGLVLFLYSVLFSPDRLWEKYNQAGVLAYGKKDFVEAEKQFLAAIESAEEFPYDDPRVTLTYNNLSEIYRLQKKFEESGIYIRKSLGIAERLYGPEHPMVASYLYNLAFNCSVRGRDEEAKLNYKMALDIWEKTLGLDDPMVIFTREKHKQLLQRTGHESDKKPGLAE